MFCPKCGNNVAENGKFCNVCGAPVQATKQEAVIQSTTYATPQPQPVAEQPVMVNGGAPVGGNMQQKTAYVPVQQAVMGTMPGFDTTMHEYSVQSGLLPWFKESITVTPTSLKGKYPSSILSIIPFGINQVNVPMDHISNVGIHTSLRLGKLIAGIIGFLLGIQLMSQGDSWIFFGLILMAWGIVSAINSYQCAIRYEKAGTVQYIYAIFFEKNKLQQITDAINHQVEMNNRKVVAYQQTSTMVNAQQVSTNAIVDAIGARA